MEGVLPGPCGGGMWWWLTLGEAQIDSLHDSSSSREAPSRTAEPGGPHAVRRVEGSGEWKASFGEGGSGCGGIGGGEVGSGIIWCSCR